MRVRFEVRVQPPLQAVFIEKVGLLWRENGFYRTIVSDLKE